MTQLDLDPKDAVELRLRNALAKAEFVYRNAMPPERPTALEEFKRALAAFADFIARR
jgi:hypothetical protein